METQALSLSPHDRLVSLAMMFDGVTETGGPNCGPLIEMFQRHVDGIARQEPYCMAAIQFFLSQVDEEIRLEFPSWPGHKLFKSESCLQVWNSSPVALRRTKPAPGLIGIWRMWKVIKDSSGQVKNQLATSAGHGGTCIKATAMNLATFIEANTSGPRQTNQAGQVVVREGDGIFLKHRTLQSEAGTMRFLGFLDPWGSV